MRIFLFLSLILFFNLSRANADYAILYDKSNKEIVHIAEKGSDFQISVADADKYDVQELNGSFGDLDLESAVQDYTLINGKFVLNVKKISDRENARIAKEETEIQRKKEIGSAKDKLKALGLTQAECDAFVK